MSMSTEGYWIDHGIDSLVSWQNVMNVLPQPVFVGGRNSGYFYMAGAIHPRLRTLLLPRQLANKKDITCF